MSNFIYFDDRKVTIWQRSRYRIYADTESQALQKMKEIFESNDIDDTFEEAEFLFDTITDAEQVNGEETHSGLYKGKEIFTNKV